ncbi:MAG: AMP-binding protein, partial [Pseudomonadota bacterium]
LAVVLSEAEPIRRQGLGAGAVSVLDVATLAAGVYDDPTPEATPKDTAYIIYTSGSTGRPKGVAIEHRSPAALIDWAEAVFGRERLDRVLASTSVCFDLSVFELFVPLSIGGTVVLVENALADPQLLASSQVTLINTVPTVASELVRQGAIPASTKTVNVAGEPLASALVRDLYAAGSVDRVYNLYGPSEDTTYSTGVIVDEREPGSFAPIGRPIAHTRAYVLDEALAPVAPGFPGELFLAGCGVARGYWNRPELTAERFLPDLQGDRRSGAVMYATGDRVRLRHDGELLFLGRIDDQVKLRGFRIEPGEIEAALEQHPQVLRAAVSLKGEARPEVDMSGRELVAYVVPHHALRDIISNQPLPASSEFASDVREFLARRLPDFMLPARFVALETIPLLPNGKVARQQLPELERTAEDRSEAPRPGPEYAMAELWRPLLGGRMPGRNDNFFALGGDSILALQLVARARAAGLALMPRDLFQYPTIAALVAQTSEREAPTIAAPVNSGIVALSAIQRWFFAQPLEHRAHWNQAVLLDLKAPVPLPRLRVALEAVRACHDALRSTFHERDGTWVRTIHGVEGDAPVEAVTLGAQDDLEKAIAATAATVQARFDLERGPLWSVVLFEQTFQTQTERRLLVICHHLLVDGVSWRILLGDLQLALAQLERMNAVDLPPASTPLSAWVAHLQGRYEPASEDAQDGPKPAALLPLDMPQGTNRMMDADTVIVELDAEISSKLLRNLHDAYRVDVDELLLTGLLRALKGLFGDRGLDEPALTLELEGHGRPDLDAEIDLSRTVGWLTTLYTVTLALDDDDPDRSLRQVKRRLRSVANRGLDDGVRRYLLGDPRARDAGPAAQLRFNYLGQADQLFEGSTLFGPAREAVGALRHPADPRGLVFDVNALVRGGRMLLYVGYSTGLHLRATVEALAQAWAGEVERLLAHCLGGDHGGGFVDEDFPQMDFDPGELDELLIKLDGGGRDRSGSE